MLHRGLDMALAQIIFESPANNIVDERKDYREMRYISIGLLDGRMVVVDWTPCGGDHRIICLRTRQ